MGASIPLARSRKSRASAIPLGQAGSGAGGSADSELIATGANE